MVFAYLHLNWYERMTCWGYSPERRRKNAIEASSINLLRCKLPTIVLGLLRPGTKLENKLLYAYFHHIKSFKNTIELEDYADGRVQPLTNLFGTVNYTEKTAIAGIGLTTLLALVEDGYYSGFEVKDTEYSPKIANFMLDKCPNALMEVEVFNGYVVAIIPRRLFRNLYELVTDKLVLSQFTLISGNKLLSTKV